MLKLFLKVTIFAITVVSKIASLRAALLEVTIVNLADAILRHGRIFVNSF